MLPAERDTLLATGFPPSKYAYVVLEWWGLRVLDAMASGAVKPTSNAFESQILTQITRLRADFAAGSALQIGRLPFQYVASAHTAHRQRRAAAPHAQCPLTASDSHCVHAQVLAELDGRKGLDASFIVAVLAVYVDASVAPAECDKLRTAAGALNVSGGRPCHFYSGVAIEAPLEALPTDLQRRVLEHLDGRSLARYAECTSRKLSKEIAAADGGLRPLWAALYAAEIAAAETLPAEPQPDEPLAFVRPRPALHHADALVDADVAQCKSVQWMCD